MSSFEGQSSSLLQRKGLVALRTAQCALLPVRSRESADRRESGSGRPGSQHSSEKRGYLPASYREVGGDWEGFPEDSEEGWMEELGPQLSPASGRAGQSPRPDRFPWQRRSDHLAQRQGVTLPVLPFWAKPSFPFAFSEGSLQATAPRALES